MFIRDSTGALVISIPLGYFGGIGAGSKNGILFKGSNFLDILANVQHVVMDKTGTMTEGVFKVQEINFVDGINKEAMMKYLNLLESKSTHPLHRQSMNLQEKLTIRFRLKM